MIPLIVAGISALVQTLAENGLSMVGNAILAKGKDVVEEKLGVKIPDDPKALTPELLQQLQIKQMEHEEFLLEAGLKKQALELEEFKVQVDDTKSARERDTAMLKAGYRNSRANTMLAGAGLLIIAILVIVVWRSPLDEYVKGIITFILGRAMGYIDQGFNFEFGTTRNSGTKDETISKLSGK